jgi:hypothetical protein
MDEKVEGERQGGGPGVSAQASATDGVDDALRGEPEYQVSHVSYFNQDDTLQNIVLFVSSSLRLPSLL